MQHRPLTDAGRPYPLGATPYPRGVNFCLFTKNASAVELLLFDRFDDPKPREVIQLLGLPRLAFPLVGMTLGWPVKPPIIRPRLPVEAVLHWEQYDPQEEAVHLQNYDQAMIDTGIYSGRQVSTEDPIPVEEYGWTEHTARRVSQVMRPHLREVLLEMGFELK